MRADRGQRRGSSGSGSNANAVTAAATPLLPLLLLPPLLSLLPPLLLLPRLAWRVAAAAHTATCSLGCTANEAKDAFLACMSHEMRTPLNGLLGMLQLAASGDAAPDRVRRYIKQASGPPHTTRTHARTHARTNARAT